MEEYLINIPLKFNCKIINMDYIDLNTMLVFIYSIGDSKDKLIFSTDLDN